MQSKEVLLNAINYYPKITRAQKQILKILINSGEKMNASNIITILGVKKQSVYLNLKKLINFNLIKKEALLLHINNEKIKELVEFYNQDIQELKKGFVNQVDYLRHKISVHLKEENISVLGFEKKAGLATSMVTKILSGETANPSTQTLIKIANAIGCSLDELLNRKIQ